MRRWLWLIIGSIASLSLSSCAVPIEDEPEIAAELSQGVVPAKGTATTLDVGCWNIEWLGSTSEGPTNETLQRQNAAAVIGGADLDLWAVEEIVSATQFNNLVAALPGYAGLLANNGAVTGGSTYYSSGEQKVGIIYKTGVASVQSAKIILTNHDYNFAGRPPLEVALTVTVNGVTTDLVFIALHAKALTDTTSYNRRLNASVALKSYLDSTYPTQKVLVAGDFNDDVDTSISSGKASPYANFVNDTADYTFLTKALSEAGARSTVHSPNMIDHQLATNEVAALYVAGTAEVYLVDQYVADYDTTTSDHYPVLARYDLSALATPAQVIVNEILANEPGSSTAGEFIELVNAGGSAADLGGWTLSDATGVRHTFAAGTSLPAGAALVVFGGASGIPGGLTNAIAASTGGLNLANGGDAVTLKNAGGSVIDSFTYGASLSGTDGVSMNRNPDGSPSGTFVLHTALAGTGSSPGTRTNGSSF